MNSITFCGKIKFDNIISYENFCKNREGISLLKHHCGNKNMTHYIHQDFSNFTISTEYAHSPKVNGKNSHSIFNGIHGEFTGEEIKECLEQHVLRVKRWKYEIDSMPDKKNEKILIERNFWQLIIDKIKRNKKCLQKKNQHVQ